MTEEKARAAAEALALGISFFVVKSEDGTCSAVQLPPDASEVIVAVGTLSQRPPDDVRGFGDRRED